MKLKSPQKETYSSEQLSALQAQRLAQEIAFGPVVFQVSRLMVKFGIFKMLNEHKDGLTQLANKLIEKEVIFGEDLELIFGKRPWDETKEESHEES